MMTSTSTFKIVDNVTALESIKEGSHAKHSKLWREYKDYVHQSGTSIDWEVERPKTSRFMILLCYIFSFS